MLGRRDVRLLLAGALLTVGWLAARQVAGLESGLLYLVPFLVLLVPLLAQRYPGERRLFALAGKLRRPRGTRPPRKNRVARRSFVLAGAGAGDVLAFELAGRAPPLLR
jgi:hypothetical protein